MVLGAGGEYVGVSSGPSSDSVVSWVLVVPSLDLPSRSLKKHTHTHTYIYREREIDKINGKRTSCVKTKQTDDRYKPKYFSSPLLSVS